MISYSAKESLEEDTLPSKTSRQRNFEGCRKKMKMSNLTVKQQTQDLTFVDELLSHLDGGLAHAGNDFTGLDSFVDKLTRRDNLANKTYNAAGKMTVKYSIIVS